MHRIAKLIVLLLLSAAPAGATNYFISYSTGSNSNSGTSEGSPWKSHPYMQSAAGCAGAPHAYSHSAGDTFTFKQGDSWPNACFDMVIAAGGTSGNPDVYTFDPTWGVAGGTTGNVGQVVGAYEWTAGGSAINGSDGFNRFVENNGNNWITFNGVGLNGFKETGTGSFGNDQGIDIQSSTNVILSNCYLHGWNHTGNTTNDDLLWFVGHDGGSSPNNVGARLTGCVIDGTGASDSGSATWKIPNVDNNIIKNLSNAVLSGANASIHDNQIGPVNVSFDSGNHANCIEPITFISSGTSTNYIYNNLFFSCNQAALLAQGVGGNGSEIDYVWNNVVYLGTVTQPPAALLQFSSVQTGSSSAVHAWNNTVFAGSSNTCIRTLSQGGPNFSVLDLQNNHCIADAGFLTNGNPGNTQIINNNTTQTVAAATAQGYVASGTYFYSPTAISNSTVGAGVNLSSSATGPIISLARDTTYGNGRVTIARPGSGAWDTGAYMFASGGGGLLQVGPGQTYTTIQACLNAATSSQTCNVHAATYTENPAFQANNVTLQRNASDTVIVNGQINMGTFTNGITDGFQVTGYTTSHSGANPAGIYAHGTTGVTIRNNIVHDATGAGIEVENSSNSQVYGNKVHDMADPACCFSDGDGIVIYSAKSTDATYAHGVQVYNNEVYQNHQDGLEINGSYESIYNNFIHDNIYSDYVSTHPDGIECNNSDLGITECPHTLIYNNTVKNHNQGIYINGLGTAAADTDIWIFNNVVYNDPTSSTGVSMATASASDIIVEQADHVHIYNNTTGSVQYYGLLVGDGGGGGGTQTNISVGNNIFTSSSQNGFRANPSSAIISLNNDDYFGNSTAIQWNSTGYSTAAAFNSATGFEGNGLSSNPLINAFPTPTLQAGSPVIGAGANLTSQGVPQLDIDLAGAVRPTSGGWDMGAYQFGGPLPPAPPVLHRVIITGSIAPSRLCCGWKAQILNLFNEGRTAEAEAMLEHR